MDNEWYELIDLISACALRFDGYEYWKRRYRVYGDKDDSSPSTLTRPLVDESRFYEDELDNLAVFFFLQRYLGKWGGERLTPWSHEHIVFRQLYLHCYRMEIPEPYRMGEFWEKWEYEHKARREEIAVRVRKSFRTVGDGAEIIL